MADTETKNGFVAKPWGNTSIADACHMLGVGDTSCWDKDLRQWVLCVTFSASPAKVTHAWRGEVGAVCCQQVLHPERPQERGCRPEMPGNGEEKVGISARE